MAASKKPTDEDKAKVGALSTEDLGLKNQLRLRSEIKKAAKEELDFRKQVAGLERDQIKNAKKYEDTTKEIKRLSELMQGAKASGSKAALKYAEEELKKQQKQQQAALKTTGGALRMRELEARKVKDALNAERQLIKDINKERGVGGKLADMFRSKEAKQRQADIARIKSGGGAVPPPGGGGPGGAAGAGGGGKDGKGGKGLVAGLLGATVIGGLVLAIGAGIAKLKGMFGGISGAIKGGLTKPLAEAANIMGSKDAVGIGGGAISGAGATSILDGLGDMLGTIPIIGGALKGLTGAFKGILDAVLGINQAVVNFARNQGISLNQAKAIKGQMQGIAAASGNIVVNTTRLLESQMEISSALGVTNTMTASILTNNVKLKDIANLEAGSRQAIAESSIITGKNAEGLTKELMGQVGYVKKMTGISFNFRNVMGDLSKLSGVLGLQFAKYPGKIAETMLKVKVLGFDLKQLRDQASGFLDFETSISKEFEAQVLTGKDMNLTKAREAALNNDMAGLSAEITRNVGNSTAFLKLNRIQQDAVAESVNMTADGLADVMKKQEMYNKLGANNQKDALANFDLLNKTKKGKDELIAKLGEENYAGFTQISTAEKLSAVMEKIKQTFIDFVEKSKIFEFLTDDKKVNGFIKSILNGLAGAIDTVGMIMAGIVDVIGDVVGIFNEEKGASFHAMAASITSGAGLLSGGMRAVGGSLGGEAAPGLGAKSAAAAAPAPAAPYSMTGTGQVGPLAPMAPPPVYLSIGGSEYVKAHADAAATSHYNGR